MKITQPTLVPIDEVRSDRLRTALHLPAFIDKKEIGIDLALLERLCRIAGIEQLRVITAKLEDGNIFSITAVNPDGTAVGSVEATSASTVDSQLSNEWEEWKEKREIIVTITIDPDKIARLIGEAGGNVNSIDHWANFIDEKVRAELRKQGLKHLLIPGGNSVVQFSTVIGGAIVPQIMNGRINLGVLLLVQFISTLILRATYAIVRPNDHLFRHSLLNLAGMELDRALIFAYIISTRAVIQKITVPPLLDPPSESA